MISLCQCTAVVDPPITPRANGRTDKQILGVGIDWKQIIFGTFWGEVFQIRTQHVFFVIRVLFSFRELEAVLFSYHQVKNTNFFEVSPKQEINAPIRHWPPIFISTSYCICSCILFCLHLYLYLYLYLYFHFYLYLYL